MFLSSTAAPATLPKVSHGLRLAPQPNCSWSPLENKSWLSSRRQSGKFSSSDLAKISPWKSDQDNLHETHFYEPNTICNGYICQVIQFESFFYSLLRGHQQPLKGSRFTKKGHQQNCQVHETLLWLTQNIFFKRLRSGLLPYLRIRILKPTKALVIGSMVRTHWMLAKVFFEETKIRLRHVLPFLALWKFFVVAWKIYTIKKNILHKKLCVLLVFLQSYLCEVFRGPNDIFFRFGGPRCLGLVCLLKSFAWMFWVEWLLLPCGANPYHPWDDCIFTFMKWLILMGNV